ncbi:MAG: homocysteine S-methyltransferase family protein [Candidatus Tantalella remota]|nr:homocysteine S-methyltransferase family protein [Candidatus Tantalella remota]
MGMTLREKLRTETVLLDGAFGTYAQSLGLAEKHFKDRPGCMEYLSIASPDFVTRIHSDYLEAGSDAVGTNTFGGNELKLAEYGLGKEVYEVNLAATRLARSAADSFSTEKAPRYVLGSIGPTGKLPSSSDPSLGNISYEELKRIFREQAYAIIDGGADAIIIETGQDLLEMKAAASGALAAIRERDRDLVLIAQCTLANNGRMLLGTEVSAVAATLGYLDVDMIGLNCSTGPLEMEPAVSFLSENASTYISCVPNAGLPFESDGQTVYPLGPEEMAEIISRFMKKYRLDAVGGCCGTGPEHIKCIREVLGRSKKRKRIVNRSFSSFYKGYDLESIKKPVVIGERINTQGSRKTKNMLIDRDYDGIVELGKYQQSSGAQVLDVCSVLTERPTEETDAVIIFRRLAESVQVPLMIDSTDEKVIKAALESYPGTAFINSVNLEDGGDKAGRVFALAKEHGAFIVCLAIDEKSMAKTVDDKLRIAERLYKTAVEGYGIEPGRLLFDLLTFTLGTGEKEYEAAGINTCEAIKRFKKKFPEALTVLGVSNISFGLSKEARKALNMVFLYHAVRAGLDMAIVNPSEFVEYKDIPAKDRKCAEDLVLNASKGALEKVIDHFSHKAPETGKTDVSEATDLSIEERLKKCIFDRNKTGIIPLVDEARETIKPEDIINDVLMVAMREVGDRLDSGEMVLPYVLQSAEVMRKAIEYLEEFLLVSSAGSRGKVLLATVAGDVHDIGKNLVRMILHNNGFEILDLGKQVPVEKIVEEARKNNVDAVGMSALLVSTARHMKTCVQSMHDAGLDYPILIGGAPVNENFAKEISYLNDSSIYKGGVFYARDAFTGLKIMQALMDPPSKAQALEEYLERPERGAADSGAEKAVASVSARKSGSGDVPIPPFYGARAIKNIPADAVFDHLNERAVFDLAWGSDIKDKKEKERLITEEYRPLLKELKEEALREGWLDLKAVYGYFKCRLSGDDMDILDESGKKVISEIHFPRTEKGNSVADYFSGEKDIVAFQAVTVGGNMNKAIEKMTAAKEDTRAFLLHGVSVHLAEALAAYLHDRIRDELGIGKKQGKRYSPGYPLWGDLADQKKIFKLLDVEKRIGVSLTKDYQMIPEQSTTAMVVHSDRAEY